MASAHLDVPFDRDGSARFLPWLIGFMVYLAALSLVSALAMNKILDRWDSGLAGQLTLQIPPSQPTEPLDRRERRLDRAIEILTSTAGVTGAVVLDPADMNKLLVPWLGEGALEEDLPLPDLIAVQLDPSAPPDLEELQFRLAEAVPGIESDGHQAYLARLLSLTRSIQIGAAVVVLLVGLSAVLAVVFVTNTGLSIHRHVIEVLHMIGAHDDYVAQQFQRYAFKLGLRGGFLGLVLAVPTVLLVGRQFDASDVTLLPNLALSPVDWAAVALLPLIAAVIAMMTARFTVLRTLVQLL